MRKGIIRDHITIFCLTLILIVFSLSQKALSNTIWKIGDPNWIYSCEEFEEFNDTNKRIIEYIIPTEENEVWEGFPKYIYPFNEESENPQEIRIDFEYPRDYTHVVLRIRARTSDSYGKQDLSVYKGKEATEKGFIETQEIDDNYHYYEFSMGPIKKGLDMVNRIIIKNETDTKENFVPDSHIIFDLLRLDDYDIDKDGIIDPDEEGGDWDHDGNEDQSDKDTASIPIKNADPSITLIKKIYLDIVEPEGKSPSFSDVGFIDPNSLHIPHWLQYDSFLPYGFLGFRVNEIEPCEFIQLRIGYPDNLHEDMNIYTYQESSHWEKRDFDLLDPKTITITLQDGGAGDLDGEGDGAINAILALSNPGTLGIEVKEGGCFIRSIITKDKPFHKWQRR